LTDTALTTSESLSRKDVRKLIYEKLADALVEYKENLKGKKFSRNLKKASKLFATDIACTIGKKAKNKKAKKAEMKAVAEPETKKKAVG
jgi:hypothetical protein